MNGFDVQTIGSQEMFSAEGYEHAFTIHINGSFSYFVALFCSRCSNFLNCTLCSRLTFTKIILHVTTEKQTIPMSSLPGLKLTQLSSVLSFLDTRRAEPYQFVASDAVELIDARDVLSVFTSQAVLLMDQPAVEAALTEVLKTRKGALLPYALSFCW